jgi:1-acyl-sn-glycerol-3-phosphate acyltransferase
MAHPARANGAYRTLASVVRPFMRMVTRHDWRGTENLHREGGFIAAANHATEIDPLTVAHLLWDNGVAPRILAKASLFKVPVLGAALRGTHQLPVERGGARASDSLGAAGKALAEGEVIVVFPEGTLTRDPDLWPMAGKTGIARLALASRAPVIPIAQWGATDLLPRYSKRFRPIPPKKITIIVGEPVHLDDLYERPTDAQVLREATDRVLDAITALQEEIRGETAPKPRFDLKDHPEYEERRTVYPPVAGR